MAKKNTSNILDSTAALAVFEERGLQLPATAETQLARAGFNSPVRRAEAIAVATLAGMDPAQLARPKNIIVLSQAWQAVAKYGAMPGQHFYLTPYEVKAKRGNDWVVEGIDYAFVPSINWLQSSVVEQGRADGFSYHLDVRPILGADKRREYMEVYGPEGWIESPKDRVAIARFIPIHIRTGERAFDPDYSVGYFLGEGYWAQKRNGEKYKFNPDAGMPGDRPNNTPQAKAERRAIRAAARKVTRKLISVDPESEDEHLRLLAQIAYDRAIDMDMGALRGAQPAEAYDATGEDFAGDDDGAVDGEYIEVHPDPAAPDPLPSTGEAGDKDPAEKGEGVTWNDLSLAVYKGVASEQRGIMDKLYAARSGKAAMAGTITSLRNWISKAAQGNEVLGVDDRGGQVSLVDFVLFTAFGLEFGQNVHAMQAAEFFPLIAKNAGSAKSPKWEYMDESEGAELVRAIRDALAKETGHVAKTF